MSDYSNKTEDSAGVSSRFEHKSRGMRTQSMDEKKASQAFEGYESGEDSPAEDKTIRLSGTSSKKAAYSKNASSLKADDEAAVSSKINRLFEETDDNDGQLSGTEGLGITVFVNRSEIPAYEIGLNTEDFYIPDEIKEGKVSKISEEQIEEMEANAAKRKKKQARQPDQKGRPKKKKKKTPAQKALKALIWIAVWLIVFLIAFTCYRITYDVFFDMGAVPGSTSTVEYTVEAGATDESVYADLTNLGVIDCTEFIYMLRAKVFEAEYIEGTYTLSPGYSTEKIINILAGYNYSDDE